MRMILVCLYVGLTLILLKPVQLLAMYYKKHGKEEKCYAITDKLVPWWMGTILWLAGVRVEVEGAENFPASPAIYICNHQGLLDIPVMLTHMGRPRAMMAKAVIGKVPLLRGWMDLFDCLFVERKDPESAHACFENAVALVQRGRDVCICPEGTRSKDGRLGKFKSGSFRIAEITGAPIVPLCLNGTRPLFEGNHNRVRPGVVHLRLFPVIDTTGLTADGVQELSDRVRDSMEAYLQADVLPEPGAKRPAARKHSRTETQRNDPAE